MEINKTARQIVSHIINKDFDVAKSLYDIEIGKLNLSEIIKLRNEIKKLLDSEKVE